MKQIALRALAGLCLGAALTTAAAAESVTVVNKSDWTLVHFYLSASEDDEWGPDQLGDEVIEPGGSFTLKQIPCDTYDVKLIDEDDDECVVSEVDICSGKEQWVINNQLLLGCEGY